MRVEAGPGRVSPNFTLDILPTQDLFSGDRVRNLIEKYPFVKIFNFSEGQLVDNTLVITSNDPKLARLLRVVASQQDPVVTSEEVLREKLIGAANSRENTRLPKAELWYDENDKSYIVCKEPSCRHHDDGSCTKKDALIQDDCPSAEYCLSYIAQEPLVISISDLLK